MSRRRTIHQLTYVVDTVDLSEREHDRRVQWVDKNMQDAGRNIDSAFVSMVIVDQDKKIIGIFGAGDTPTDEIAEIARELTTDG